MPQMLNRVILMGRLTRDPEIKQIPSGVPVTTFSLAVDKFTPQGQDKQADFFNIVAWRQTAEFVSKYFRKGQLVAVEGKLSSRKWTDKDGNNRTSVEVVADSVFFAEAKRDSYGGGNSGGYDPASYNAPSYDEAPQYPAPSRAPQSPAPQTRSYAAPQTDDSADDLPF